MLEQSSWLPQASSLQIGQKKYAQHECGDGRKLVLSRDSSGYSAWCFRCNDQGWAPGPKLSLAERLAEAARQVHHDSLARRDCSLPEPRVLLGREWPSEAALWLLKAGLGWPEIARLGAYYHPPTNRVVLPVLDGPDAVFWQARSIDGRLPKYLSPPVDRSTLLPRYGAASSIILTEDLLSAFKVGIVGEAWCLMGTYANARLIAGLLERQAPVAIWLDPDAAGRKAAGKVLKQLSAYGIEVRVIRSERDPKLHTFDEIKECIR